VKFDYFLAFNNNDGAKWDLSDFLEILSGKGFEPAYSNFNLLTERPLIPLLAG
jgi:hypothetical protein